MQAARLLIGLGMAALLCPGSAGAASTKEIFQGYGLLGAWAVDCSMPASRTNPRVVYRLTDDRVQREASIEPGSIFELSTAASTAEASPTELVVTWNTTDGDVTNRIILEDGKMQVRESTRHDGLKLAANGRQAHDGSPTPRLRRCDLGPSASAKSSSSSRGTRAAIPDASARSAVRATAIRAGPL